MTDYNLGGYQLKRNRSENREVTTHKAEEMAREEAVEDSKRVETQELQTTTSVGNDGKMYLNKYVLLSAILASMNSVLLGYDIGVMSGAVLFIKDELKITSTQEEILIGSLNICSLLGSLAAGKTSDWIGRRYTIMISSAMFLAGALLMGLAPSFAFLMMGRVVSGIGVGYSLMIAPVYTAELSPAATRGFFTSFPEVFITVGILLGYISNYAFAGLPDKINWRLMVGIAAIPAVIVGIGITVLPESPRWLMMQGRSEEAKKVLMRTSNNEREAESRFIEMTQAMVEFSTFATSAGFAPSSSSSTISTNAKNGSWRGKGVWKELLLKPSPPVRRMLMSAIGMNFFMQASGNDAVMYYSPEVFRAAGIHRKKELVGITIAMGFAKTCFVLLSALYLDKFGRRPLLLLGSTGVAVSLAVLGVGSKILEMSEQKPKWAIAMCVVAVCADVSFFSIGLGPITWVYSSEIFPTRLRAQGTSIAVSVNRVVSGAVAMSFLSISKAISFGYLLLIFAGISTLGTLFFYSFLPETKGKSLEEMETLFEKKQQEQGAG